MKMPVMWFHRFLCHSWWNAKISSEKKGKRSRKNEKFKFLQPIVGRIIQKIHRRSHRNTTFKINNFCAFISNNTLHLLQEEILHNRISYFLFNSYEICNSLINSFPENILKQVQQNHANVWWVFAISIRQV